MTFHPTLPGGVGGAARAADGGGKAVHRAGARRGGGVSGAAHGDSARLVREGGREEKKTPREF